MFRKILLSGVAALGLALPLAFSTQADAREHRRHHDSDDCYYECEFCVYYRESCSSRWCYYGTYESEFRARHAVRHLEHEGYEAFMRSR